MRNKTMNARTKLAIGASMMCFGIALGALIIFSLVGVAHTVRAQDAPAEKVVYSFVPARGYLPTGVIRDGAGNLYVATGNGGGNRNCYQGCGNILKLTSPDRRPIVLYTFGRGLDNDSPFATGPTRDAKGNLYGATVTGGRSKFGTVFKLKPSGVEGILHEFPDGADDGYEPSSGLTIDSAGNLYGVTRYGGNIADCGGSGCGTIYKVTSSGDETVLYAFPGSSDGTVPEASPVLDGAGNLYGTAVEGGDLSCPLTPNKGCGTVWKLGPSGDLSVLYSFTGGADGALPAAGLAMDSFGNLYGDAFEGGNLSCGGGSGCGVVFEINSSGNFTVLYSFTDGSNDGQGPQATLLRDNNGNLYGTTVEGGDQSCSLFGSAGCGVVFKLDTSGNETILHAFAGGTADGESPESALISDGKGNLYGTTPYGGTLDGGVIFGVQAR
jgi:uncharacterized repeat protein (TIGR03803 family)